MSQEFARHARRGPFHGGRKHQGLALGRHHLNDAPQLRHEAHVEQAVGLVDDQHLDAVERSGATLDVIDHPAGTCDEHVSALAQVVDLTTHRFAADHQDCAQLGVACEDHEFAQHLRGELAGRLDNQRGRALRRFAMKPIDERN